MSRIPDREDRDTIIVSKLREGVEQSLKSSIEINYYEGSLKEALSKDKKIDNNIKFDHFISEGQVGLIISTSMLSPKFRDSRICYIAKDARLEEKIHELFHWITPFSPLVLPILPSIDQLIEHHVRISLDEFWADYQSVLYLNCNGIHLDMLDLRKRGLMHGEALGSPINQCFQKWLNYRRDQLTKKIIYLAIKEFFSAFKPTMYLLGLLRGSHDTNDAEMYDRLVSTWNQFKAHIQDQNFLKFIYIFYANLFSGTIPEEKNKILSSIIIACKEYILQGFIPLVFPSDVGLIHILLREEDSK